MQVMYRNAASELITLGEPRGKRTKVVSSSKSEGKGSVYLHFRYCKAQCFSCNQCGWAWGVGHDKLAGKPAVFAPPIYQKE
jgi:hypothetical protein